MSELAYRRSLAYSVYARYEYYERIRIFLDLVINYLFQDFFKNAYSIL